jgi:hypothetical protein
MPLVKYPKALRALARERNQTLVTIHLSGEERDPKHGELQFQGPVPGECAAELRAMLARWQQEEKV